MSLGFDLLNCNFEDENNNRYSKHCLVKLDEWDDRWMRLLCEIMKCGDVMAKMTGEDNGVQPSCSKQHVDEWVENNLMLDDFEDKWTWLCDEIKKHKRLEALTDEKNRLETAGEFYDWFSDKSEDHLEFSLLPNPPENKLWYNITIFSFQEINPGIYDCWATFPYNWGARAYVTWYSISVFIVPLIVLVVTYSCICYEIWHSSVGELGIRPSKKPAGKRAPLISRAKINTVKQTIAVIVMYIVCSTPFISAQLWATWDPHADSNPFLDGPAFTILTLLYSLNSCVNPWIYLAFNRELPRLLIKRYTNNGSSYAAPGNSTSNSSGAVESTSLRPFTRWSFCNSTRTPKMPTRQPQRQYVAHYNARRWIVSTAT